MLLQRDRSLGGLGLPSLIGYYWAANTHKIMLWFNSTQSSWCQIEAKSCTSSSLQALAFSTLPLSPSHFTANPIVSSLRILAQIRHRFGWSHLPQTTLVCSIHLFLLVPNDFTFGINFLIQFQKS